MNDTIIKNAKVHIDPDKDIVTLNEEVIEYKEFIYLMMNKPQGVISATEDAHDKTVIDFLELEDIVYSPFPVGRLDKDTEGLLLITNDGQLGPSTIITKKACAQNVFCCY